MHNPDELKALVDEALERLDLWPELHGQATSVRYALEVGGKRVRPVIALAVGEALGAPVGGGRPRAPPGGGLPRPLSGSGPPTFSPVPEPPAGVGDTGGRERPPLPLEK